MTELVAALTSAGVCGLGWVAWRYPAIFQRHFTVYVIASPWIALVGAGIFFAGYDLGRFSQILTFVDSPERQAQFLGLLFAIALLGGMIYAISKISPHRRRRVPKQKARSED